MDGEIRFDVAILLATRKRTQALSNAVKSIVNKAEDKRRIQIILAFDEDDDVGLPYFLEHIKPWLRDQGVNTKHIVTERYGYS